MITTKHKKAVILSALMFSLTGASAYAQAPGIAGSQNGMSQSSMIDVKADRQQARLGKSLIKRIRRLMKNLPLWFSSLSKL